MTTTIDITGDAGAPWGDGMPEPAIIRDDQNDVLLCLGDVVLKMTEPQAIRIWEALGRRYQAHAEVGNNETEQEV